MLLIREATLEDVPGLVNLMRVFAAETTYRIEFDEGAAQETLATYIVHPECAIYVADYEGVIVGMIKVAADKEYQVRPFGLVAKMFVAPVARGTGVARELVANALAWFERKGCTHAFATSTAGIGEVEQQMFTNLFTKFGFTSYGPCLGRVLG